MPFGCGQVVVMIPRAAEVIRTAVRLGWDDPYGGLLLFVDQQGGIPGGSVAGEEEDPMVQKVLRDWDSKVWWTHSEGLYATLLAFKLTGDPEFLSLYRSLHQYAFATFPNSNRAVGEWIQIRDRAGRPQQKVVALPVKDPYHVIRAVVLILESLRQSAA